MPGVFNLSVDEAVKEVRATRALGVLSVILFGLPEKKDEVATGAWAEDGIVQKSRARHQERSPRPGGHGRCLPLRVHVARTLRHREEPRRAIAGCGRAAPPATAEYEIVNDASLELLARTSVSLARAGVDIIAPSDMMDGRVGAIRTALDTGGLRKYSDSFLCRQVRLRLLRSVPRGSRFRAAVRGPPFLPDGSGRTFAKRCARSNWTLQKART